MTYSVPHIAVINKSTVVSADELAAMVVAVQRQVQYHFHPHWNRNATMAVADAVPVGNLVWPCYILDHTDQAGALGYHDDLNGVPILKVFAADDQKYGVSISVDLSHEVLETLTDPLCNQAAQVGNSTFWAQEVCDACEDDRYAYPVTLGSAAPVMVSDFVLPAWFTGDPGPYSYRGNIKQPFQLLPGGYIGEWTPQRGWSQRVADEAAKTSHRIAERAERNGQTTPPERIVGQLRR